MNYICDDIVLFSNPFAKNYLRHLSSCEQTKYKSICLPDQGKQTDVSGVSRPNPSLNRRRRGQCYIWKKVYNEVNAQKKAGI